MANEVEGFHVPVEGVHLIDDSTYRQQVHESKPLTCETCSRRAENTEAGKLMRCQGCWSIAFCSQQCQSLAWPTHKQHCRTLKDALALEKLISNYYHDAFLLHHLRVALIHKLNWLNRKPNTRECLVVLTIMRILPTNEKDMVELALGMRDVNYDSPSGSVPGRLKLNFTEDEPGKINVLSLTGGGDPDAALLAKFWRKARRDADTAGRKQNPIVIVDFGYEDRSMPYGIEITKDAFNTAKNSRPSPDSFGALPTFIKSPSAPWTGPSVLGIINEYIEKDTEDALGLRTNLKKSDKLYMRQILSS